MNQSAGLTGQLFRIYCTPLQTLRSATKNSAKVNAAQFVDIMKSSMRALDAAAHNVSGIHPSHSASLPVMKAKRGMPKSKDRVNPGWDKAPTGFWPDVKVDKLDKQCVCSH